MGEQGGAVLQLDTVKHGDLVGGEIEGDADGLPGFGQGDLCVVVHVVQQKLLLKDAVHVQLVFISRASEGEGTRIGMKVQPHARGGLGTLTQNLSAGVPRGYLLFGAFLKADALLFLSVLTSRLPQLLIEPHIQMATTILHSGIESIPMGYLLIDGGRKSSVEIATNTQSIPQSDVSTIVQTAVAGQLLGKQLIYLEAGSGAQIPVSAEIIRAVRAELQIPLIVGGGITTPEAMIRAFEAGSDIVVIGNHFEQYPDEIADFVRIKQERYD